MTIVQRSAATIRFQLSVGERFRVCPGINKKARIPDGHVPYDSHGVLKMYQNGAVHVRLCGFQGTFAYGHSLLSYCNTILTARITDDEVPL